MAAQLGCQLIVTLFDKGLILTGTMRPSRRMIKPDI
jgi:hypothetical protein